MKLCYAFKIEIEGIFGFQMLISLSCLPKGLLASARLKCIIESSRLEPTSLPQSLVERSAVFAWKGVQSNVY